MEERKGSQENRKEPVIPRAYSMDLRERLVHTVEGGMSVRKAACQLMIGYSWALKWMRQFRRKGNVQPKRQGGYRKSVLLPYTRWILQYIEQKPDETLGEIRQSLIQKGVRVGIATLWRFFQRHQISIKKKRMRAQEQDREEIAQTRARWENDQRKIPAGKLVFIDETGTNTQMSRRDGRCAKKRRLIGKASWGQWKTTTFVTALRSKALTAPMVLDGPLNGESFRAWVQQCLLPTLRPGDVVVMDNLAAHKVSGIRQAIESSGAKLFYLPPYFPDLNPIEFAFSKLKSLLRKAAARTVRSLWKTVGNSLRAFTPDECHHFFKAAGYHC